MSRVPIVLLFICSLFQVAFARKAISEDAVREVQKNDVLSVPDKDEKAPKKNKEKSHTHHHVVKEVHLGCSDDENPIRVYVLPSCRHCGSFLLEDGEHFLKKSGAVRKVIVTFLPVKAKDHFVMKLIQNKVNKMKNKKDKAEKEYEFYYIFLNYIATISQNISFINPTKEQIKRFKGSSEDPEMIKFQVGALINDMFTEDEVDEAFPNMDAEYEHELAEHCSLSLEYIAAITKSDDLGLPLIAHNDKKHKDLDDAVKYDEEISNEPNW